MKVEVGRYGTDGAGRRSHRRHSSAVRHGGLASLNMPHASADVVLPSSAPNTGLLSSTPSAADCIHQFLLPPTKDPCTGQLQEFPVPMQPQYGAPKVPANPPRLSLHVSNSRLTLFLPWFQCFSDYLRQTPRNSRRVFRAAVFDLQAS